MSRDIDELSAAQTARLVSSGALSQTQSLEAAIRRIEARNPSLNAFAHLGFEDARQQARRLEQRLAYGEDIGALADFALPRPQQELSAPWCKLVGTRMLAGVEGMRAQGIDRLRDENDLPAPILASIEDARGMTLAGMVDGLPVGLQIIGRRRGDADVLAACAEFERAQPWAASYALTRQRVL